MAKDKFIGFLYNNPLVSSLLTLNKESNITVEVQQTLEIKYLRNLKIFWRLLKRVSWNNIYKWNLKAGVLESDKATFPHDQWATLSNQKNYLWPVVRQDHTYSLPIPGTHPTPTLKTVWTLPMSKHEKIIFTYLACFGSPLTLHLCSVQKRCLVIIFKHYSQGPSLLVGLEAMNSIPNHCQGLSTSQHTGCGQK